MYKSQNTKSEIYIYSCLSIYTYETKTNKNQYQSPSIQYLRKETKKKRKKEQSTTNTLYQIKALKKQI